MEDYLEKVCISLGIKLSYTTNKVKLISCGINNSLPILRVHKMFKGCTENVAQAIIGYYTGSKPEDVCLRIIDEYLNGKISSKEYKIQPPNEDFTSNFIKNMPVEYSDEIDNELITEFKISSIEKTDFYGNKTKIDKDGTITPPMDDVIELNIVVIPPFVT